MGSCVLYRSAKAFKKIESKVASPSFSLPFVFISSRTRAACLRRQTCRWLDSWSMKRDVDASRRQRQRFARDISVLITEMYVALNYVMYRYRLCSLNRFVITIIQPYCMYCSPLFTTLIFIIYYLYVYVNW